MNISESTELYHDQMIGMLERVWGDGWLSPGGPAEVGRLLEGMEATLRLLDKAFEKSGLGVIDPVGQPFNPEFHEAMATQPSPGQPPGSVLAVVQKGYTLNGRLLRPARVLVARAPDLGRVLPAAPLARADGAGGGCGAGEGRPRRSLGPHPVAAGRAAFRPGRDRPAEHLGCEPG